MRDRGQKRSRQGFPVEGSGLTGVFMPPGSAPISATAWRIISRPGGDWTVSRWTLASRAISVRLTPRPLVLGVHAVVAGSPRPWARRSSMKSASRSSASPGPTVGEADSCPSSSVAARMPAAAVLT